MALPPSPSGNAVAGLGVAAGGLNLFAGLLGFMGGQEQAGIFESRARLLRAEAEADAQRFAEEARMFKKRQKLAFLKSGVDLTGSPLEILDETVRVSAENISAIRARGRAQALTETTRARVARAQGRGALISGFSSGAISAIRGFQARKQIRETGRFEDREAQE